MKDPFIKNKQVADYMAQKMNAKKMGREDVEGERELAKATAMDKADSPESKALYDSFAQAGVKVKPGMSANQILSAYGKPAEYALAKFKEGEDRKTQLAVAGQKAPAGQTWSVAADGTRTLVPINPAKSQFEQLPKEQQEAILELGKDTANKSAIVSMIDSITTTLDDPKVPTEQKLAQANQSLKVLNSTQGKDAVGAEEAKRLSSYLEFHIANFTNPGPVFGRADISEFAKQAKLTSAGIKNAMKANQTQMERLRAGQGFNVEAPSAESIITGKPPKPPGDQASADIQNRAKAALARRKAAKMSAQGEW
jgi:hypothetical protein